MNRNIGEASRTLSDKTDVALYEARFYHPDKGPTHTYILASSEKEASEIRDSWLDWAGFNEEERKELLHNDLSKIVSISEDPIIKQKRMGRAGVLVGPSIDLYLQNRDGISYINK